jgi:hypothetical protein
MTEKACVIKRTSPSLTLRNMKEDEKMIIRDRDMCEAVVRATASRLRKNGFAFSVSKVKHGVEVRRLK